MNHFYIAGGFSHYRLKKKAHCDLRHLLNSIFGEIQLADVFAIRLLAAGDDDQAIVWQRTLHFQGFQGWRRKPTVNLLLDS